MDAMLGRKSNADDFIQKSVVANKLSGRDPFLDYPLLKRLLLDLARLFRDHSDTSSPGEHIHGPVVCERLQNHDDVVGRFEHYLQQENWSMGKRHVCMHCDVWDRWTLL